MKRLREKLILTNYDLLLRVALVAAAIPLFAQRMGQLGNYLFSYERLFLDIGIVVLSFGLIGWELQKKDFRARAKRTPHLPRETMHVLFQGAVGVGVFYITVYCLLQRFVY